MTKKLGILKQGNLREIWNHEAIDFTNWLAEEANLALLSDEIGIDIVLIQTEACIGKFNVDILAEEESTGRKIIIENQLESTDHDHLGKIITYASGYDAEFIIWVVKDIRDEHKKAIDWLNEHSDENINFFAIRMEVWQIDESPFAPKFHIVSQPNDWAKALKTSAMKSNLTEIKSLQLDFWNKFREYVNSSNYSFKLRKARPRQWYNISIGVSNAHVVLTMNSQQDLFTCEIYVPDSKNLFYSLEKIKDKIENEIGAALDWLELEDKKANRIKLYKTGSLRDIENWNTYFKWLADNAQTMHDVFPKYIRELS